MNGPIILPKMLIVKESPNYLRTAVNKDKAWPHTGFPWLSNRIKLLFLMAAILSPLFIQIYSTTAMADEGAAEESIFEESGIPEGFERLTEPQTTKVDVYFGGRFLISTPAVFTPESIELIHPDQVIQHIPESSRKEVLTETLSGSLDRHDDFLCEGLNCPVYNPDVAGVIFDEPRFRLTLLINKNYLPPPRQPGLHFLPASSADGAFLQTGNLLFSGSHTSGDSSSPDSETWTFFGQSTLSFREKSLESRWDQDKERGFGIRSLSLASDRQGFYYNAGLIPGRGFGLTFSPDHTLLGVHMGSSARTLMDDGFNQSTRLPVFRANRGRVDVLRDGRLIHTEFQEAGNQLINTQSFPSGAYEITIKVYDGNILQDEETRFFVKTTFLPPSDIPQYFFELGQRANSQVTGVWPTLQNGLVTRTGYNFRLDETSSLSIAGAASNNEALTELSWLKLGKNYQLGVSAMLADRGRFGYSSYLFKQWRRLSTQLSFRRLSSTSIHFGSSEGASNRPQLLNNGFQQGSASFSLPLFSGSMELRRSFYQQQHPKEGETGTTRTDTISWSGMLWSLKDFALRFRTEVSQNRAQDKGSPNKSLSILGNIELNQRHYYGYNKLSHQTRTQKKEQPGLTTEEQKRQYRLATTWYDRELLQDDLVIDAFAEESEKSSTVGAGIRFTGQYLDTSVGLNHVITADAPSVSTYSGRLSASLITNGESVFFGGRGSTESGLLIKLNGKIRGSFDIWVNGQRQGYSSIGNSALISLTPFNTYKVFIRPQGEGHFEYDEAEHEFTLYPGNIQTLSWDIEQVLVLIGQLEDLEGNPVSNVLLEGVIGTSDTDSLGLFQARILDRKRTFEATLPDGSKCRVTLPELLDVQRGIVLTGPLTCEPL